MRGQDPGKLIRGGGYVEDMAILGTGGAARWYRPSEVRSPSNGEGTANYRYNFRFAEADKSWNQQQIKAQAGGDNLTKFKNFRKVLDMQLHTAMCNFLETAFWAPPDANLMESLAPTDGKGAAYSFPALVNHSTNTLPVANSTSGSSAFTTIGNISPATNANWQNQVGTYNSGNLDSATDGLFTAFDSMTMDIGFESVPGFSAFRDTTEFAKLGIFTNKQGRMKFIGQVRDRNCDLRAGPQDPAYGNPVWNGVPVEFVEQLNTALVDPSANYTTAYPDSKPPFWFLNFNFIEIAFQQDAFMSKVGPVNGGRTQPDTDTMFINTHPAVICSSRRRQGVLYGV